MEISNPTRGLVAAAAIASLAALAACERHHDVTPTPAGADPSAVVIGTAPANPTGAEPPGVTPVASNTKDISKATESTQKPQEGDNHSYSTEAHVTPQKSEGTNPTASDTGGRK
jgi:hypothetical protein